MGIVIGKDGSRGTTTKGNDVRRGTNNEDKYGARGMGKDGNRGTSTKDQTCARGTTTMDAYGAGRRRGHDQGQEWEQGHHH